MSSKTIGATGLDGRYATALFGLADDQKQLDSVAADLESLNAMIEDSDDLKRLISSPVISGDDQDRAMAALLEAAEISDLTRNFVGVVTRNRRLFALPGMIDGFVALLKAKRGEATAEVVSAVALSKDQINAIEASIKKVMGTKVSIDASVDASLLGGLVVKIGSRMIDSSLKTKLGQLRLAMKGVG
mgnify:CR=1 FL=1